MADPEAAGRRREEIRARLKERFTTLRADLESLRLTTDDFFSRLAEKAEEALREEFAGARGEDAAWDTRCGGSISAAALRRLDEAESQVEILNRFLEECLRHASRVALLVAREPGMEPWKAAGFALRPGEDAAGRLAGSAAASGALARVIDGFPRRLPRDNDVSLALGAEGAAEAILVPFVVREKISGILYADAVAGEEKRFDRESVALLTYVAGLAVDRLASRKLRPAPSLASFEGNPEVEPATEVARRAPADMAPPSFASVPTREQPGGPLPREDGPDGRVLSGPLAPTAPDERREEARRFARLLASEIKLYNEPAVREGRERGNLYGLLAEDIDRGRRLYEERVPEEVRAGHDFYREELVEVLAEGRREALGME